MNTFDLFYSAFITLIPKSNLVLIKNTQLSQFQYRSLETRDARRSTYSFESSRSVEPSERYDLLNLPLNPDTCVLRTYICKHFFFKVSKEQTYRNNYKAIHMSWCITIEEIFYIQLKKWAWEVDNVCLMFREDIMETHELPMPAPPPSQYPVNILSHLLSRPLKTTSFLQTRAPHLLWVEA